MVTRRAIAGAVVLCATTLLGGADAGAAPLGGFPPPPPPIMSANFVVAMQASGVQTRVSADGSGATTLTVFRVTGTETVTARDGSNLAMNTPEAVVWSTGSQAFLPVLQACTTLAASAGTSRQPYLYFTFVLPAPVRVAGGTDSSGIKVPATVQPTNVTCALQM
jgi:hypothetical protein